MVFNLRSPGGEELQKMVSIVFIYPGEIWLKFTRCDQKITVIFKFRELYMLPIMAILDCQFVFDR